VVGGGLEFRSGPVLWSPGIRLTRWRRGNSLVASGFSYSRGQTEIDGLLTISYSPDSGRSRALKLPCCFEAGILAGVPLNSAVEAPPSVAAGLAVSQSESVTQPYALGAILDWRFHRLWSVEGSMIVRRGGYNERVTTRDAWSARAARAYIWDLPAMIRWRPVRLGREVQLSLGAGANFRTFSGGYLVARSSNFAERLPRPADGVQAGAAAAAGIEVPWRGLRFRPEVRYLFSTDAEFPSIRSRGSAWVFALPVTNRSR
jgi:hypothetical protein